MTNDKLTLVINKRAALGAGRCDRAVEEFAAARRLNPHLPLAPETGWTPCLPPRPDR